MNCSSPLTPSRFGSIVSATASLPIGTNIVFDSLTIGGSTGKAEMVKLLNLPDVKALFLTQGMDTVGNTPAQFTAYIQGETEKWTRVVRTLGIPPQ